ncbi:T9SS type B sorting domain-containing protein [Leeuwenhoekiella marinoflava]|uniref:Gliding motility-associated-like protein n=2 Tax=Leeuwenhoekiella marinoflava TaxID=988 RepID=A0A4Q0PMP9_9FLAO|nr:T9SS type B sorting domain-containing protein [Leeuwenhoekiella marinoflava]RXG29984.1 gliding motility-associated-like protein [Leeuwenhoekiella marinoflava]SHF24410.1 gliding motility-associated C-terminal domain-containing protein [Leeuwenhoekiella marinoflava DSM 3653]
MNIKLSKLLSLLLLFLLGINSTYAQAPILEADADQIYCPLSSITIAPDFDLQNPGGSPIDALYIQISSGYERGTDFLEIINLPNLTQSFNPSNAKLTLNFSNTVTTSEIIAAVRAVTFRSSRANISGRRVFSITIGQANYLASTDHYYEYVPDNLITWQAAKTEAEGRTYYGLQGYLATLTSLEEAVLCGEQTQGAGWIGGTDEAQEGVWEWVTGPEGLAGGVEFWRDGPNGSTTLFAYWNSGEPNNVNGGENYAHITAPGIGIPGSWNDLRTTGETNVDFQPKGYLVEYGGMPGDPSLKIATSTSISIPTTTVTGDTRCGSGSVNLSATTTDGILNWYDAPSGGNLIHTGTNYNPTINTTQNFYVAGEALGCNTGGRKTVTATILDVVDAADTITITNCDEDGTPDGFTDFNLNNSIPFITNDTGVQVTFYQTRFDADTNSGTNVIAPESYNNQNGSTIYSYTENANGCFKVSILNLKVSTTSFPSNYVYNLTECDTDGEVDGFHNFDLTEATVAMLGQFPSGSNLEVSYYKNEQDALLANNEITSQNSYTNEIVDSQTLYVRVENTSSGSCFGIGPHLQLTVEPIPVFDVLNEGKFCSNASSFTLETINARDLYTYNWTDDTGTTIGNTPSIVVTTPGIYTVTAATTYGCESVPKTIEVIASEVATLDISTIEVTTENEINTIRITDLNQLGIGDYEFALDDALGPYQDEAVFRDVAIGFRMLYVRDKNGCGISNIEIPVLGFPKYFTPNNDGYHDEWGAAGLDNFNFTAITVYIYNRYGKLLKSLVGFDQNWDGTVRDKTLPSDEYWYTALLTDSSGELKEYKGHFSLKR